MPSKLFFNTNQWVANDPRAFNYVAQTKLPFLATLNILYLTKLTIDWVLHNPIWPPCPTKLPSYIHKFEGEIKEDPTNHVMTFHIWCSLNYLMDYSISFLLFQMTLTMVASKRYIDLPQTSFQNFNVITMDFLKNL